MPVITFEGPVIENLEVKRKLVQKLTDAAAETFEKIPREAFIVLIKENPVVATLYVMSGRRAESRRMHQCPFDFAQGTCITYSIPLPKKVRSQRFSVVPEG